jgi:hypothetical protein
LIGSIDDLAACVAAGHEIACHSYDHIDCRKAPAEEFARTRHGLDPEPNPLRGPVTLTPPGGLADLRAARGGDLINGPFDEYARTPDFRRLSGLKGRWNIPKVNVHIFRQVALRLSRVTPLDLSNGRYMLDPSGRDVALFRPGVRGDPQSWRPVREWEIAAPIPCRLLNDASFILPEDGIPAGLEPQLALLVGQLVRGAARLRATLTALLGGPPADDVVEAILASAITADSPKRNLIPSAVALAIGANSGVAPLEPQFLTAGDLGLWGTGLAPPPPTALLLDPTRGRVLLTAALPAGDAMFVEAIHLGAFGAIGAGYDRRAGLARDNVTVFDPGPQDGNGNDLSPGPVTGFALPLDGIHELPTARPMFRSAGGNLRPIDQLTLQARDRTRPYIRLVPDAAAAKSHTGPAPAAPPRS